MIAGGPDWVSLSDTYKKSGTYFLYTRNRMYYIVEVPFLEKFYGRYSSLFQLFSKADMFDPLRRLLLCTLELKTKGNISITTTHFDRSYFHFRSLVRKPLKSLKIGPEEC